MLEDKHRAGNGPWFQNQDFLLVSEAETGLWLADSLPQLFSEQSLWLFIWMSIYIVAGHYKDYPQSQYFLGSWHQAWWLNSLCHPQKKCSTILKTWRFIPCFSFFSSQKGKAEWKPSINFCSRYPVFQIRLLIEEGKY